MNILLWVLQVALALHTVMGAIWKFSHSEKSIPSLKAIPHKVWLGLSVFEILCAIALVLPAVYHSSLCLASIGAGGVAAEMLAFSGLHLYSKNKNNGQMIYWLLVAIVSAFVAYGRCV